MHPSSLSRSRAALALGASLGDRARTLRLAAAAIAAHPAIEPVRASRVIATPPVGGIARAGFLNAVLLVRTSLAPTELHALCRRLEQRLGRRPARRWADRVLDIDLLLYEDVVLALPALQVPHPRIGERPFVLQPLAEAWPDARDPVTGRRWADLPRPARPYPVVGVLPFRR